MPKFNPWQQQPPGGTTTTTQRRSVEDIIEQGPGGGGGASGGPLPIGVPAGYTVPVPHQTPRNYYPSGFNYGTGRYGEGAQQPRQGQLVATAPRYMQGDEWRPAALDPRSIAALQHQMVTAGLIGEGQRFNVGVWDDVSRNAYTTLLAFANARGVSESAAMQLYQASVGAEAMGGEIVGAGGQAAPPPLQIRHTPAQDLEPVFREAAINLTGRGWNQDEVRSAIAAYNQVETQRQTEAYNLQLSGQPGTYQDIPSASSFIESRIREQDPEEVAVESGLGFIGDFLQMATGPAWGG